MAVRRYLLFPDFVSGLLPDSQFVLEDFRLNFRLGTLEGALLLILELLHRLAIRPDMNYCCIHSVAYIEALVIGAIMFHFDFRLA